ncbi:MAG TPA: hypothetical protein VIB48_10105 [Acidimicrobiia bacterium]
MQNRVRGVWLVACASVLIAAGCGGGHSKAKASATTSTIPTSTACNLVTTADATKLFGEQAQVSPDASRSGGAASVCVYDVTSTSGQLLQVRVYTNDQYYAQTEHPGAVELTGIGDRAFVSKNGPSGLVDFQFVKGHTVYSFAYSNLTSDAANKADALVALGRQVAGAV